MQSSAEFLSTAAVQGLDFSTGNNERSRGVAAAACVPGRRHVCSLRCGAVLQKPFTSGVFSRLVLAECRCLCQSGAALPSHLLETARAPQVWF